MRLSSSILTSVVHFIFWLSSAATSEGGGVGSTAAESSLLNHTSIEDVKRVPVMPMHTGNIRLAVKSWILDAASAQEEYGHISDWNTSRVTDTSHLLRGLRNASIFNEDLSNWDMSSVTDMRSGIHDDFCCCLVDLSLFFASHSRVPFWWFGLFLWDSFINSPTDCLCRLLCIPLFNHSFMFYNATSFNSEIGRWSVSKVTNFSHMFANAVSFDVDLSHWYVTDSHDFSYMFHNATEFDSNVSSWMQESPVDKPASPAIHMSGNGFGFRIKWAQTMRSMFQGASSFNGDVSRWQTYAVIDMNGMFKDATRFEGNLASWNVQLVRDFGGMFQGASRFRQHLCWPIRPEADTSLMFQGSNGSLKRTCHDQEFEKALSTSSTSMCIMKSCVVIHVFVAFLSFCGWFV